MKPETFNEIYELISPRLNVVGDVRTKDAWTIAKHHHSYDVVCAVMRECLATMVEQRKAVKIQNGVWRIIKPNEKPRKLHTYIKRDIAARRKKKLSLFTKLKDHLYNQVKQSLATDAEIRRLHVINSKIKKLKG